MDELEFGEEYDREERRLQAEKEPQFDQPPTELPIPADGSSPTKPKKKRCCAGAATCELLRKAPIDFHMALV
jgi:hypothetical protein